MTRTPFRLILLLLIIWAVWIVRLSEPYYGVRDGLEIWIPVAVRNLNVYGADTLGYMVVRNAAPIADPTNPAELQIYTHHPPLVVWLPALFTRLVGFHELGVRYVFAAASFIAASAFYVMVRRLFDAKFALWALGLFAFTPMIAYFLTSHNHDPLGFMVVMLFGAVLVNWHRHPTRLRLLALCALAVLAAWTAWPAVFFVAVLSMVSFLRGRTVHRVGVIAIGISGVIAVAVLLMFFEAQAPGALQDLLDVYVWRASDSAGRRGAESFTMIEWLIRIITHIIFFGTAGFVFLALMGIVPLVRRAKREALWMTLGFLIAGCLYLLAFRNASFIHDYYKTWLHPSLAISGAAAVVWLRPQLSRGFRALIDGSLLVLILHTIFIMAIMLMAFNKPKLAFIIETINQQDPDVPIYVNTPDLTEHNDTQILIEFYTHRTIHYNETPDEVPENAVIIDCNDITVSLPCAVERVNP